MAKVYGWQAEYEYSHSWLCHDCKIEASDAPEVHAVTIDYMREEAIWCEVCDDLVLPSEANFYEESTEEDRERFIESGKEYELD